MHGQKLQLAAQNDTLASQRFDNSFFQLLALSNTLVNSIDIRHVQSQCGEGRISFKYLQKILVRRINDEASKSEKLDQLTLINIGYNAFIKEWSNQIWSYLETMYTLLFMVDKSDVKDKIFYINIIRAQVSGEELAVIFYTALSESGNPKLKSLIEKYGLLRNLQVNLICRSEHTNLFDHLALRCPEYITA